MLAERDSWSRQLALEEVDEQLHAALYPGDPRVEDQVDEAAGGRDGDAADLPVPALLGLGHRSVFVDRQGRKRAPVLFPIAVGGVMEIVVLRPDVLWHAGHHAEEESKRAVEPGGAEQAAVAAIVHQCKHAQREQADESDQRHGQPQGNPRTERRGDPQECQRYERRGDLGQRLKIVGLRVQVDDVPFETLDARRRHGREPPVCISSGGRESRLSLPDLLRRPIRRPLRQRYIKAARIGTKSRLNPATKR